MTSGRVSLSEVATQLVIVKHFTYRGADEEWSSVYHFDMSDFASLAAATSFAQAVRDLEKPVVTNNVRYRHFYAYNDGDTVARYSGDLGDTPGTLTTSGVTQLSGDTAYWIRWATGDTNSRGKPIYLRKYFHPAIVTTGSPDSIASTTITALNTYGAAMVSGTIGGVSATLCRPNGHHGSTPVAGVYATTRTLRRRGKRPS
jgi:hypothetical protein